MLIVSIRYYQGLCVGRDMLISLQIFLEVVIKRMSKRIFLGLPQILIDCWKRPHATAWKQKMQNTVMATLEFFLGNTK